MIYINLYGLIIVINLKISTLPITYYTLRVKSKQNEICLLVDVSVQIHSMDNLNSNSGESLALPTEPWGTPFQETLDNAQQIRYLIQLFVRPSNGLYKQTVKATHQQYLYGLPIGHMAVWRCDAMLFQVAEVDVRFPIRIRKYEDGRTRKKDRDDL